MALSRRAFLVGRAGCVAAPAATANAQRRQPADLSTSVGFPDPARHWRGESSVAAAIRAGQFFRAPSIVQRFDDSEERTLGYHNPDDGGYRLRTLSRELSALLG